VMYLIRSNSVKFGKRLSLLVATAALSLAPAISSLAQGMTCTLAAADCQTLATADANAAKETSFALQLEFSVSIKGDSPVAAQASGQGQFAITPGTSMTDPTAMGNAVQASLDITGSSTAPSASNGSASLVVTGGVIYFKTSTQDWKAYKLSDVFTAVQSQMAGAGGGFGGAGGGANPTQITAALQSPAVINAFLGLQNIKGFITQEKTANTPQLENQTMSEFVDTISPSALLSSPDFATALKAIMAAVAPATGGAGAAGGFNSDQLGQMMPLFSQMLGDTNLKITRWVGQTDNMYHAFGLDLNLNVNTAAMGGSSAPVTGTIHFLVKLTKIGQPVTVTAPAGVTPSAVTGGGAMPSIATPTPSS